MYLLGCNATSNASLSPAGNYVIWSARLKSSRYKGRNLAEDGEIKSYYIIARENLGDKSINDHLTRMATDEIINANASWVPLGGQKLTLMLATIAMQMQHERTKGALS